MKRHGQINKLKPLLTNYWGERVLTQLLYLEEVNRFKGNRFESLLDECADMLNSRFEADGGITKSAALEIEGRLCEASDAVKEITVSCLAHAHIDMNWMWRFDETVAITIDTFRTMLSLMNEYEDFTFSQSQASVYKMIEEFAPDMLDEIRQRIQEGRWEVTASAWVETDKNMPSGESLTRHILYTRRYLSQLLGLSNDQFQIDFEPDTFGHNMNVPEILSKGGIKYYYHCRGYDKRHLYRWRSPSGAEITVFRDPTWYNATIGPESFQYIPSFCWDNKVDRMIHVYGVGNHGGGATRRDIERIKDYNTWPCMPRFQFGRYIDFFRYTDSLDLPVVTEELNFVFNGCYTTQTRIKRANRVSEAALYEAEALNAVSALCGAYQYSAEAFAGAWENVLFNHFHDILPGSGTIDTREYAMGLFQRTMACAGSRTSAAVRGISAKINTAELLPDSGCLKASTGEGAGVGFGVEGFAFTSSSATAGLKRVFNIFNPVQTAKNGLSMITVWDWEGDLHKLKVTDERGEMIPHELVDSRPQSYWGHTYFRALLDCEIPPFGYRSVLMDEADSLMPFSGPEDLRTEGEKSYILENDFVKAVFDVKYGALISFTDKETGREYLDKTRTGGIFNYIEEDSSEGMTAWRIGRYMSEEPVVTGVKIGNVSGSLRKAFSYEALVKNSKIKAMISLDKNSRTLVYEVTCDWKEFGIRDVMVPQLSFKLPVAFDCDQYVYDTAFGVIGRKGMNYDVPGLSFAFAGADRSKCEPLGSYLELLTHATGAEGNEGLMLVTDSKYGFRCYDNSMALSLIRSSYDPDPVPECFTHTFKFGVTIMKDANAKSLLESSLDFCHQAITVAAGSQRGELPLTASFLKVYGADVIVSSVKMPEDGDDFVIIRAYEVSGKNSQASMELFREPKSAVYVDTHEKEISGKKPLVSGNSITVEFPAFEVVAIKVEI